jgi:hypothetical protein
MTTTPETLKLRVLYQLSTTNSPVKTTVCSFLVNSNSTLSNVLEKFSTIVPDLFFSKTSVFCCTKVNAQSVTDSKQRHQYQHISDLKSPIKLLFKNDDLIIPSIECISVTHSCGTGQGGFVKQTLPIIMPIKQIFPRELMSLALKIPIFCYNIKDPSLSLVVTNTNIPLASLKHSPSHFIFSLYSFYDHFRFIYHNHQQQQKHLTSLTKKITKPPRRQHKLMPLKNGFKRNNKIH